MSASAAELNESRIFQGLTGKQETYARARAQGLAPSVAYREAYDCANMQADTISRNAMFMEADNRIVTRVGQLLAADIKATGLATLVNREFVLNGIANIALTGDKDSTKLNAYIALGKTVGIDLFRDVTVIEKRERTPEDVERELKEKLDTLRHTIEGVANPVKSEGASSAPLSPRAPDALPSAKLKPRDRHAKSKP